MTWIVFTGLVIIVAAVYCVSHTQWARRYLLRYQWFVMFYDKVEPIEKVLWAKSKTMFFARLYQLAGALVTMQAVLTESGIDWLAIIPVPPQYQKFVGPTLWVTGLLFSKLRKMTTEPLEVVGAR